MATVSNLVTVKEKGSFIMEYNGNKDLEEYIYEPSKTVNEDSVICPKCKKAIDTSDIYINDMSDGDYEYGICPHCGSPIKLMYVESYYFEPELCTKTEFENVTGEKLEDNLC